MDQAPEEIGQELRSTSTRMQIERRQLEPKSAALYHTHIQLFKSRAPKKRRAGNFNGLGNEMFQSPAVQSSSKLTEKLTANNKA